MLKAFLLAQAGASSNKGVIACINRPMLASSCPLWRAPWVLIQHSGFAAGASAGLMRRSRILLDNHDTCQGRIVELMGVGELTADLLRGLIG